MMRGSFLVNNSTGDVKIIAKILDNGDLSKGREDDPSHEFFVYVAHSPFYCAFTLELAVVSGEGQSRVGFQNFCLQVWDTRRA